MAPTLSTSQSNSRLASLVDFIFAHAAFFSLIPPIVEPVARPVNCLLKDFQSLYVNRYLRHLAGLLYSTAGGADIISIGKVFATGFVLIESQILLFMSAAFLDLKGVSVMKDRKFFEKATDVRCETEVSFTELTEKQGIPLIIYVCLIGLFTDIFQVLLLVAIRKEILDQNIQKITLLFPES